jgi:alpha-tubulin suppressor-like RCC1 family protein
MSDFQSPQVQTNFKDSNGADLGTKLVTKDYLISVYPSIGSQIGIPPELWVWGFGASGRLGNNDTTNRSTPVTTFAGGTNWKQVSCGYSWTTAIKTDGTLWTWGFGGSGRLGTNDLTQRSTPVTTFAGGTDWKYVDAGNRFTAAIKTDGTLWIWGNNADARLGTNDATPDRSTPVTTFAGGTNWKQISLGYSHAAAIKTDGTLWVWGNNYRGKLGTNDVDITRSTPVTTFAGGTDWKQVSSGSDNTAAIKTDGTLWIWGRGAVGRLGTNDTINRSTPVTTFAGGTNWKQVSSGDAYTAAIKTDGTLWTWGAGSFGRHGNNDDTNRSTPVTTFTGGTNWKQVSSSDRHTTAIKTDGTLWTWGSGSSGRHGNNDDTSRSTPVTTFAGGTNWKQVSSGEVHTAAIRSVDF